MLDKVKAFFRLHKSDFIVLLVLIGALLVVFDGVLRGQIISNAAHMYLWEPWVHYRTDDIGNNNFVMSDAVDSGGAQVYLEEMRKFKVPMWFYNSQLGVAGLFPVVSTFMNPITLVLFTAFGTAWGWHLRILLSFVIGGFFMYKYLRLLKVNNYIAIAFAIGYAFSSGHLASYINTFAATPLYGAVLFYASERLLQSNKWKDIVWLIVAYILLITIDTVHLVFFFLSWNSVYILVRIIFGSKFKKQLIIKFACAIFFSILLSMIFLIPTFEYIKEGINLSYRSEYALRQNSYQTLFNLFFPHFFGDPLNEAARWTYGTYVNVSTFVGYLVPISILTGGVLRLIKKRDAITIYFFVAIVLLLGIIYSFPFETIEQLINKIPFFRSNPSIYQKTVFEFMLSTFGALGLSYLFSLKMKEVRARVKWFLISVPILLTGFAIWGFNHFKSIPEPSEYLDDYFGKSLWLIAFALCLYYAIVFRKGFYEWIVYSGFFKDRYNRRIKFEMILLSLLSALFILEANLHSQDWISYSKAKYYFPEIEMTKFIKERIGPGRVISLDTVAVPQTMAAYGFPVAAGRGSVAWSYKYLLQTAYPEIYTQHPTQSLFDSYKTDFVSPVWDLVDLRFIIGSKNLDTTQYEKYGDKIQVHKLNDSTLIERKNLIGHAFLASDGILYETHDTIEESVPVWDELQRDFKDNWDVQTFVALEDKQDFIEGDGLEKDKKAGDRIGEVTNFKQELNQMSMDVKLDAPGYLVISSAYYPGWNAYVDGEKAEVVRAYQFLSAVKLTKTGEHKIEYKYEPQSVKYGVIISSLGLIALTAFLIVVTKRNKNNGE